MKSLFKNRKDRSTTEFLIECEEYNQDLQEQRVNLGLKIAFLTSTWCMVIYIAYTFGVFNV